MQVQWSGIVVYLKWHGDRRERARGFTERGKDFGNGQPPYAIFGHPTEARRFAALHYHLITHLGVLTGHRAAQPDQG